MTVEQNIRINESHIFWINEVHILVFSSTTHCPSPDSTEEREAKMSTILGFLFVPPSLFVKVMSAFSFFSMSNVGISEFRGKNMKFSKFLEVNSRNDGREIRVPSRIGMLIGYTPALVVSLASLAAVGAGTPRRRLLSLVLSVHFFKRFFEVLFIHRYSGEMMLNTVIQISFSYFISTITMIYAQYLSEEMAAATLDLRNPGITLYLIGITGNFYHHYLLSKLRKKDDKGYKIPRGGLFGLVICPHYFFEIIEFIGVAFISQTIYAFYFTLGSMFCLMGRSYATRKWYLSKFKNFPNGVKALIPYVY